MIAALLLALAQELREEPSHLLPAQHAGRVVLRGGEAAPLPDDLLERTRVRIVLGEAKGAQELTLRPHDWIADAPATLARLEGADVFEFAGGSPYRLLEALYPKKSESRAIQVLRERHRLGATVIGTGAGAGFVSALTLGIAAERERPERNPRRTDPIVSLWSLSILPWALVATDVETAGDLEPFYAALIERHVRLAIFLTPEATLTVDPVRGDAVASGDGGVLLLDLRRARRTRTGFTDGRLVQLQAGDRWDVRTRTTTLGPGEALAPEPERTQTLEVEHALATESLRRTLARLGAAPVPRVVRLVGPDAELTFTHDADTRAVAREGDARAFAGARIDLRLAPEHLRP
ncbi:MAG: hypothetical protein HZA52_15845 [Planctomycetes bacterium]|nr:hypothetical protein [Planctomycetota bacterium]